MIIARTFASVLLQHTPAAPRLPFPKVPDPFEPARPRLRGGAMGMLGMLAATVAVTPGSPRGGIAVGGWSPDRVVRVPSRWL